MSGLVRYGDRVRVADGTPGRLLDTGDECIVQRFAGDMHYGDGYWTSINRIADVLHVADLRLADGAEWSATERVFVLPDGFEIVPDPRISFLEAAVEREVRAKHADEGNWYPLFSDRVGIQYRCSCGEDFPSAEDRAAHVALEVSAALGTPEGER